MGGMSLKDAVRVFFLFLGLYLLTMGGHLYSPDEEIMFRTTQALAEHGSLAIEPLVGFATKQGADGREYAQYGIGQPLLAIPFYYMGKLLYTAFPTDKAPNWVSDTIQYHDYTPRDVMLRLGVSFFNQFITALLCATLFAFAFYVTRDRIASWMTTLLFGLGTYAWVHSKPFFTEPLAALFTFGALFLLFAGLDKNSMRRIILAGALYAYALLVRMDSVFMLPGFLLMLILTSAQKKEGMFKSHFIKTSILFLAPMIGAVIIMLVLNKIRFGAFFRTGYEDQAEGFRFSTPLLAGLFGFLFTAGRGLFFFSPPLLLTFFTFGRFFKHSRILAIALLGCVLTFFLIQCKWQNWAGGWCWGPRHIYQIHIFLALPIAFLFTAPRRLFIRCVFWAFLVTGLFVQIYGCSENFIDYYSEFFTSPRTLPNNYNSWYIESEKFLDTTYGLYLLDKDGRPERRIPLHYIISPIQNSIYYPQNSVWANYIIMLKMGRHDFFWLKLLTR